MNSDLPLYNSKIIDTYLKFLEEKYPDVDRDDLLKYAEMTTYEVADQAHWFTQRQINRFYERLFQVTKNPSVAREAGRYAASPETSGLMRQYFLGLIGPAKAFGMIGKAAGHFTRSSTFASRKVGSNKVEVTVYPLAGIKEERFQCENRMGFLEAIVMMFHGKAPDVTHPECIFQGGTCCRYVIKWDATASILIRTIRNVCALILPPLIVGSWFFDHDLAMRVALPGSLGVALLLSLAAEKQNTKELKINIEQLWEGNNKLVQNINTNYNSAMIANEIGQAISERTNINDILDNMVLVMEKRMDFDRGVILLANPEQTALEFRAGYGYNVPQRELLKSTFFSLDRSSSKGVFVVSYREQKSFLINNINEIRNALSERSFSFAKKMGVQSFICCPIICEGISLGVLVVDNVRTKRPLVKSDMSLLMGIAPVIGISIRNAELLEAKLRQFTSTLQIMAASIDARDPLTAGHSEKVTEYAIAICREMRLADDYTDMVRVAALLHDYGKIAVPDAILKKNGKLTPLEYELVKTHTFKTREILEQIAFEGVYREVPIVAASHHEKLNGTGYPQGLKGEQIPLGAQIIAVADFFEAITAKRHYRNPMPIDDAFNLLREEAGIHFRRDVVEALIKYYSETYQADLYSSAEKKTGVSFSFAPDTLSSGYM